MAWVAPRIGNAIEEADGRARRRKGFHCVHGGCSQCTAPWTSSRHAVAGHGVDDPVLRVRVELGIEGQPDETFGDLLGDRTRRAVPTASHGRGVQRNVVKHARNVAVPQVRDETDPIGR